MWVAELAQESHPMVHDLCEHHAGTVSVPRGWELRDERHPLAPAAPIGSPAQSAEFGTESTFAARASVA